MLTIPDGRVLVEGGAAFSSGKPGGSIQQTEVYDPRVNSWNSCCEVVDDMLPRLAAEIAALPAPRQVANA